MIPDTRASRRAILIFAAALIAYAIVILITGGFILDTPWGTLTSRAAIRPFIAGGLVLLFYRVRLGQHWPTDTAPLHRVTWPPLIAGAASVTAVAVGVAFTTTIAGGPDASGYVSQADLLARGALTLTPPAWLPAATWPGAAFSAAAVGYMPSPDATRFVPTYAPGLPLLMAAVQLAAGADAVFYVVPILGGVLVWATWLIGKGLGDGWAGASAAILMLASPIFVLMLLQPMSDVPAAAFWALSLAAALRQRPASAGVAASVAILIRPNTVVLAAVPLLILLVDERRGRVRCCAIFTATIVPAAAAIGLLLRHYFGSPFHTGYGSLEALFGFDRVAFNATHYARWFLNSQTALPLLGVIAPAFQPDLSSRLRTALVVVGFPSAVLVLYLLYEFVMPEDVWMYLRFLLPAYPSLMVGFAIVMLAVSRRAKQWFFVRVACALLIWWVAVHGWQYARDSSVFGFEAEEQRYARAAAYARSLPPTSVIVSLAHSGTLRFYAGREVLRFDALGGEALDAALAFFEARGKAVFLIGDLWEINLFGERFAGTEALRRVEAKRPLDLDGTLAYALTRE
jgi:hypothetical protein